MKRKEPYLITFEDMQASAASEGMAEERVVTDDFAMVYRTRRIFEDMIAMGVPYRFNDSRVILVVSGEADIMVNLISHRISAGMVAFFAKSSTIQMNSYTEDFMVEAIAFGEDYVNHLVGSRLFKNYEGRRAEVLMALSSDEIRQAEAFFALIWQTLQSGLYNRDILAAQITSMLFFLDLLNGRRQKRLSTTTSRTEQLFNHFIHLVNTHHTHQRSLAFYASQLCITDKYLCLVVKQASGFTAKDWVDRALTTSAKMLLKRTDMQVSEIADQLNFPHASSFCKFFKRMTDITPQEYREGA